jgi:ATP-dependent Clp protease ATP-binding subunit ClpB
MSEYMEKHAVARLIGAPPGYVGYDEGGQLTEAVRRRPYSVILFDEIEKAHPDVFNVLLQVMDDGRLTDSKGRTVDFKNTVLIMTSNLGANLLLADLVRNDHDFEKASEQVLRAVREHFRPEFLNRVDDMVVFRPLGSAQMHLILDMRLNDLRKLLESRAISLELTEQASQLILLSGSDAAYGARPLKRALQRMVQDPLAIKILNGEIEHGSHVRIDVDRSSNQLSFTAMGREAMA